MGFERVGGRASVPSDAGMAAEFRGGCPGRGREHRGRGPRRHSQRRGALHELAPAQASPRYLLLQLIQSLHLVSPRLGMVESSNSRAPSSVAITPPEGVVCPLGVPGSPARAGVCAGRRGAASAFRVRNLGAPSLEEPSPAPNTRLRPAGRHRWSRGASPGGACPPRRRNPARRDADSPGCPIPRAPPETSGSGTRTPAAGHARTGTR